MQNIKYIVFICLCASIIAQDQNKQTKRKVFLEILRFSGFVIPIKIHILARGLIAFEVHHFLPLIIQLSPSETIELEILVASDEATSGSVIAKQERISPLSNGLNHWSFCSCVPNSASIYIFPVSGAEQLNTSGAHQT